MSRRWVYRVQTVDNRYSNFEVDYVKDFVIKPNNITIGMKDGSIYFFPMSRVHSWCKILDEELPYNRITLSPRTGC
jgi:hypothetical protein